MFHHFASLALRESGDRHGTFSGCSSETVKTIALEDCAIIWTMWFILFAIKRKDNAIALLKAKTSLKEKEE
ncbi:MAG: hypothetical protein JXR90_11785 [Spirochaetes bacterium]|nr:hypothetical protein [Spirochaetota bacterium]